MRVLRKSAVAVAVLAMVVYATIVSWHGTVRALERQADAALVASLGILCHGGASAPGPAVPGLPAAPSDDACPICQASAAAGVAVLAADPQIVAPRCGAIIAAVADLGAPTTTSADAPRNRGPPAVF